MNRLLISCPFGNYLSFPGVTSTLGTYTLHPRAGRWRRLWRVLSTVRPWPRAGAKVNRLGLPSPGIAALEKDAARTGPGHPHPVYGRALSVHGFDVDEWLELVRRAVRLRPLALELNLSCPNVASHAGLLAGVLPAVKLALECVLPVVAKLPPLRWLSLAAPLHDTGVRHFHCCNTIPCPGGGMSGKPLKPFSLWAVEDLRARLGDAVVLIGGGGVTCLEDVKDYVSAGADHVAVGSVLFNPLAWRRVGEFRDYLEGRFNGV